MEDEIDYDRFKDEGDERTEGTEEYSDDDYNETTGYSDSYINYVNGYFL